MTDLLREVEAFLKRTGTPPSRFGRDAVGDPALVFDLREGREVRPKTAAKVRAYIDDWEGGDPRTPAYGVAP